jgi:Peptidase A4 family
VLEATYPGSWSSVWGNLSLPYLWAVPSSPQAQYASLSGWVGLDGWGRDTLFQACILSYLDTTTNPPSAAFQTPYWQWWIPNPSASGSTEEFVPGSGSLANPPPMESGNVVQLSCGYTKALDGALWGYVGFVFFDDLVENPYQPPCVMANMYFQGPTQGGVVGQGDTIEWILENEAVTMGPPGAIVPVFSGSPPTQGAPWDQVTPVTFHQAGGSGIGGSGDADDGVEVVWQDGNDSVALSPEQGLTDYVIGGTVSITYTS